MSSQSLDERTRSLEEALADLVAKYEKRPTATLAQMIRQLEMEIAERKGAGPENRPITTAPKQWKS
jgi:hypothetical protein